MTRTGKIARLPRALREELNGRLQNGAQGKRLVAWLNAVPEAQAVLKAEFGGRAISEQNLSEWKQGGYREWQAHREALERAGELAASASELTGKAGAMADHLAIVLTSRYVAALAEWDGDLEGGNGQKLRVLRALCQDVVELRRGDHSAARLKLEQARVEAGREQTEEELLEHFERWAKNPTVRAAICGGCVSPEDRERRLREIFGLPPLAASPQAGEKAGQESNPIQPNPTS